MQDESVTEGTLPAGFQFGAYVIGSCIGRGGMARVYRAEHSVLCKPVALKIMDGELLDRPDGRPRFLREGQAAAAVKHPNVVDITDVGVWQGRPYLVMELLEGEDLERYLGRHAPLGEQDVARIMIPVIAGLVTAHAAGVIHRDLKPSNVFLARGPDGDAVPKVLDFGISKLENGLRAADPSATPIGELMGSPMYMSPEAVRGARDLTPHSDQYSLGVMLYECVTGRPPFRGDSLLAVLEAVAHGQFESPRRYRPELSTVLEVAIVRAMSRDPADRYPSLRELGRALCEAADQRTRLLWAPSFGSREPPLHARSTPSFGVSRGRTGSSPSLAGRRGPPLWPVALAALALVVLALGAVAYYRMPSTPYAVAMPRESAPLTAAAAAAGRAEAQGDPVAAAPVPRPAPHAASVQPADAPRSAAVAPVPARPPAAASEPGDARLQRAVASVRPRPPAPRAEPARAARPERGAEARQAVSGAAAAAPDRAPARAPAADPLDDELVFPVRAPPARPAVLGANQSPILD